MPFGIDTSAPPASDSTHEIVIETPQASQLESRPELAPSYDLRRGVDFDVLKGAESYYEYDTSRYDFAGVLRKMFDDWDGPLEALHAFFDGADTWKQLTIDNDTQTRFHQFYYSSPHYPELMAVYRRFVAEVVLPVFGEQEVAFAVQKDPSFRINLPNNSAIGWRPGRNDPEDQIGLHCDGEYGHPPGEMNFMLSFTEQWGSNSCYTETGEGTGVFNPITMPYGSMYRFYGNKCMHYNKMNRTGQSRVSFDFRVIPGSRYDHLYDCSSLHGKRRFVVGDYFCGMLRDGSLVDDIRPAIAAAAKTTVTF